MGLFVTLIHIYKKDQDEIVSEVVKELKQSYSFSKFSRIKVDNSTFETVMDTEVYVQSGIYYLISQPHGNWTTIVELNIKVVHGDKPIFLGRLTKSLSRELKTYALSFNLHDGDLFYYNLTKDGKSLDSYNSDYQYFLNEPANKNEVLTQRHNTAFFSELLSANKNPETLNSILNEGYWTAFDNNDLDEDGRASDEEYYVDEEERFKKVGNYLEIFKNADYPFADGHVGLLQLNLSECYLLRAERTGSFLSKLLGK
jgi:hypothetical protein